MNYALCIVSGFAILKNEIDAKVPILNKFAVLGIQNIGKTKYFLVVCFTHIHNLVLVCLKVLIKKNECSLIIEINLIYHFN